MKKCSLVKHAVIATLVVATGVFTFRAAAATQRNWTNLVTTATSPQKALDWSDPGNWEGGNAALTKNDIANINNTAAVMYFKMPGDITLGAFHNPDTKTAYLIGGTIRPDSTAYTGSQGAVGVTAGRIRNNVYVYADVKPVKDLSGMWSVCGDLNVSGSLTSSIGSQIWRGDLYANSADEVRKDEVVLNSVQQSSTRVSFYAPRGCAAHSNAWSQVEGSPYLKLKDKSIGVVAPGCRVSGVGIPDGTFLRRYYEGCSVIELSQPVTETIESNVVNFAAYTPKTYGRITSMNASSNSDISHYLKKFREEDVFEMDVGSFSIGASRKATIRGDNYPGRYILHRTTGATGAIVFENADLFFAEPTSGTAGFAYVKSLTVANEKFARLTVTNGVDAVCTNVAQSTGSVTKEGAGSLRFAYAPACTSSGKVTVKEGVFEAAAQAESGVTVSEVALSAGATYRVVDGVVTLTKLSGTTSSAGLGVADGAVLNLPNAVTVGKLSGGGTINGAVALAENAVFAVPVDADGTITQTLTVSGAVDLSKGGTVQLTGDSVGNLKAGKYRLIASAQLGAVGSWTVTGYAGRKILKLKADADGLWLEVVNCGLVLFVH